MSYRYENFFYGSHSKDDVLVSMDEWSFEWCDKYDGNHKDEAREIFNLANQWEGDLLLVNANDIFIGYAKRLPLKIANSKRWGKRKVRR
ncbi:MAG: hypothetical protein GY787_12990 [Alteromonadales bacterium]|nr:hypothetical protein [Alteromonadales bacterium]